MNLVIVNRHGLVHRDRDGRCCGAVIAAPKRVPVTPLQARVYQLPGCDLCFDGEEYRRMVVMS